MPLDEVVGRRAGVEPAVQAMAELVAQVRQFLGAGHRAGTVQTDYAAAADGQRDAAHLGQRHMHNWHAGRFGQLVKVSLLLAGCCVRR